MSKVNAISGRKNNEAPKLLCPVCSRPTGYNVHGQYRRNEIEYSMLPQATDLTQCDHCLTLLEFVITDLKVFGLRAAPTTRVKAFEKITREPSVNLNLSSILTYVKKYRQMPMR